MLSSDTDVLRLLTDQPQPFIDLYDQGGDGMDRADLAHALRRLWEKGHAQIVYGSGWRRLPAGTKALEEADRG